MSCFSLRKRAEHFDPLVTLGFVLAGADQVVQLTIPAVSDVSKGEREEEPLCNAFGSFSFSHPFFTCDVSL